MGIGDVAPWPAKGDASRSVRIATGCGEVQQKTHGHIIARLLRLKLGAFDLARSQDRRRLTSRRCSCSWGPCNWAPRPYMSSSESFSTTANLSLLLAHLDYRRYSLPGPLPSARWRLRGAPRGRPTRRWRARAAARAAGAAPPPSRRCAGTCGAAPLRRAACRGGGPAGAVPASAAAPAIIIDWHRLTFD